MSALAQHAEEYLTIRRALGYKLTGYDAVLGEFTDWLASMEATVVTADLAVEWATRSRSTTSPVRQRQLLTTVRGFAEYLHAVDPRTGVPAKDVLPARHERKAPYLYSPAELAGLMTAARSLTPPLKAATYETLIGLLACTGLRWGEAAGLDRTDVSLVDADLVVRFGKNGRSRHVPIHETTVAALAAYAAERDRLCPHPAAPSYLVSVRGRRLAHSSTQAVFAALRHSVGLGASRTGRRPRIHDLRHGFIVATMVAWHRDGEDVQARLPVLSTYVGHVDPKATYWYQQAAPELLALAARRLEPRGGVA